MRKAALLSTACTYSFSEIKGKLAACMKDIRSCGQVELLSYGQMVAEVSWVRAVPQIREWSSLKIGKFLNESTDFSEDYSSGPLKDSSLSHTISNGTCKTTFPRDQL